jgi:hypothetical protein
MQNVCYLLSLSTFGDSTQIEIIQGDESKKKEASLPGIQDVCAIKNFANVNTTFRNIFSVSVFAKLNYSKFVQFKCPKYSLIQHLSFGIIYMRVFTTMSQAKMAASVAVVFVLGPWAY